MASSKGHNAPAVPEFLGHLSLVACIVADGAILAARVQHLLDTYGELLGPTKDCFERLTTALDDAYRDAGIYFVECLTTADNAPIMLH